LDVVIQGAPAQAYRLAQVVDTYRVIAALGKELGGYLGCRSWTASSRPMACSMSAIMPAFPR